MSNTKSSTENRNERKATGLSRRRVLGAGAGAAAAAALPSVLSRSAAVHAAAVDPSWTPRFFTPEQGQTVATLCDLILPRTRTPSATDAGVHEYIDEALSVADGDEQLEFLGGLAWLEQRASKTHGSGFGALSKDQQVELLEEISDGSPADSKQEPELTAGATFFTDLKARTLFGYYTSKLGRTEALGLPEAVKRETFVGCTHGAGEHKG